ncbi:hypothetical protein [Ectothiorhodospira shaposhnikovii]|uniref:hypothetical protein n=1 Tax=Ectothiorhodospira shaposhnikovii TaxID=1054 RepID=UPI001EE997DE|nr:hypothetical protein [Ectothiorhodospira shaposhnikovii]MCG5512863.1 hypothetical protein [Ectothiorhodospira shaposhnikovii]
MSLKLPLNHKLDSSGLEETPEDSTIRKNTEGGYTATRPRHTRRPRMTFKLKLTNISQAEKAQFESFWMQVKGSVEFELTHPVTKQVKHVRFEGPPRFVYSGIGSSHRWDVVDILVREV